MMFTDNASHVDAIVQAAKTRLDTQNTHALQRFAELYFAQLPADEAERLGEARLADILASHFRLLQTYDGTAPKIRVFNPQEGGYTVVEIVMRDRPFLVDTLMMGIESHHLTLHRLLNNIMHVSRDAGGHIDNITPAADSDEKHLSIMFAEIDRIDEAEIAALASTLQ